MCGRFALTLPADQVADIFDAVASGFDMAAPEAGPRYNICPTQPIAVLRSRDGERTLTPLRWGFLPRWYKAPNGGPLLINARSETLAEKPAFAQAAREGRCLIPASGFYEWRRSEGPSGKPVKEPFWISPAPDPATNRPLVAFAGVWRDWTGPDGTTLSTCAIVTTGASPTLSAIHHRLPLAIAPEDQALWLGEAGKGAARLMNPPADDFWGFHAVDSAVNKASADGPELMAPIGEAGLI